MFFLVNEIKNILPTLNILVLEDAITSYLASIRSDVQTYLAYIRFSLEKLDDEKSIYEKELLQELLEDQQTIYDAQDVIRAQEVLLNGLISYYKKRENNTTSSDIFDLKFEKVYRNVFI